MLDAVVGSVEARTADRKSLAVAARYSPVHVDRVVAAAAGESPTALRRRLLLERAAWHLQTGRSATDTAAEAGYGSLAAFSRAFSQTHGVSPRAFAASGRSVAVAAMNGVHFHPPAGLSLPPSSSAPNGVGAAAMRLLSHHLAHSHELLLAVERLDDADRLSEVRPGQTVVWFDDPEPTVQLMAERLVASLEVWGAAIRGATPSAVGPRDLLAHFDSAARTFTACCDRIERDGGWGAGFVDALCSPPESFVHADVLAHVLEYGAARRHMLTSALQSLGAPVELLAGDPLHRAVAERGG